MADEKRKYRRFTTEEKLAILREAEQPGVTAAAVCRKHALSPNVLYGWRAVAQQGAQKALKGGPAAPVDSEVVRLQAELVRLRAVVTEITAENLELKKKI